MINNQRVFSIFNHKMISQWPSKMNVSRWLETTLRCWSFYQQNWGIVRGCPWHFLEERSLPAPNLAETLFVGGMISFSFWIIFNILLYRMNIQTMGGFRWSPMAWFPMARIQRVSWPENGDQDFFARVRDRWVSLKMEQYTRNMAILRGEMMITIWLFNSSTWKDPPFSIGKPLFLWAIYTMANCES